MAKSLYTEFLVGGKPYSDVLDVGEVLLIFRGKPVTVHDWLHNLDGESCDVWHSVRWWSRSKHVVRLQAIFAELTSSIRRRSDNFGRIPTEVQTYGFTFAHPKF